MDFNLPTGWDITWPEIVAFVGFCVAVIWGAVNAYRSVMVRFDHIEAKMTAMEIRNSAADHETAIVKDEQNSQRVTIAVMSEQLHSLGRTLDRIDRNVEKLSGRVS